VLGHIWAKPDLGQIGACQLASVGCVMIRVRSLPLPTPGTFVTWKFMVEEIFTPVTNYLTSLSIHVRDWARLGALSV